MEDTLGWADLVRDIEENLLDSDDPQSLIEMYESIFPNTKVTHEGDSVFTVCSPDNEKILGNDGDVKTVIKSLLSVMDMQEKRENEEFHIPQPTAWKMWSDAKEKAERFLRTTDDENTLDKILNLCQEHGVESDVLEELQYIEDNGCRSSQM